MKRHIYLFIIFLSFPLFSQTGIVLFDERGMIKNVTQNGLDLYGLFESIQGNKNGCLNSLGLLSKTPVVDEFARGDTLVTHVFFHPVIKEMVNEALTGNKKIKKKIIVVNGRRLGVMASFTNTSLYGFTGALSFK
ncbi:MAG: hypothetical protein OXB84_04700, partial [Halobacteriovoraceae bacterium]|nr:hypothetical protein [Halobacteriovoraceae bacterium]